MSNPLLAKVKIPGRIFQLPSKGIFYEAGVLADHVTNAEIEIKPLSALAEVKLRSPDMLFSGRALREICEECIPDILKPEKLTSKDVDGIFCFLRIVTYGSDMSFKSIHDCPNRKVNSYNANIELIVMNPNNKSLEHADLIYQVKLSNDQLVKLRPVIFQDAIDMTHLQQEIEQGIKATGIANSDLVEKAIIRDLMAVIKSVDDISDRAMIDEWARQLPKSNCNEILEAIKIASDWGFNLNVDLVCKDCSGKYVHELELNPINFFSG